MVPYFRHLGKSDELIASLDVVEESVKEEEAIVVDKENPPHLQMKFGMKNPPDPKLSSSIILPSSGDM